MKTNALPTMTSVKSSNVEAVGHHGDELHVKFKTGGHYVYRGVPPELHREALASGSIGKFLATRIIGKFTHRKM